MTCDIITRANEIGDAYRALAERCCDAPPILDGQDCLVPWLLDIYAKAKQIEDGVAGCNAVTVGASRPEVPECLSDEFLIGMRDWILGMSCDGEPVEPGDWKILHVYYEWDAPSRDLDTCTGFLDGVVGWSCGDGAPYMTWSGDNIETGPEIIDIDVDSAWRHDEWADRVEISLKAGWYTGWDPPGSGPARIRVFLDDRINEAKTIDIAPGSQDDCASTPVGRIVFWADGTFELEGGA